MGAYEEHFIPEPTFGIGDARKNISHLILFLVKFIYSGWAYFLCLPLCSGGQGYLAF